MKSSDPTGRTTELMCNLCSKIPKNKRVWWRKPLFNTSNQFHPSPWWKAGLHFSIRAKRWRIDDLHPSGRGVIRRAPSAESITIAMELHTFVFTSLATQHDLTMIDWAVLSAELWANGPRWTFLRSNSWILQLLSCLSGPKKTDITVNLSSIMRVKLYMAIRCEQIKNLAML